jgi:hypothetical protein
MSAPYFVPVADLLPYWPHDLVAPSDVGILGRLAQYVGVTELDLIEYEGELVLTGKLALWQELALDLPLVDGVALVLGQPGPNLTALPFELDFGPASGDVAGGAAEKALDLFLKGRPGPYELLLPEVDVGLRFDPEKLRPMRPKDAADLSRGFEPDPAVAAVQLNFRAAVAINTETGVRLAAPGDLDLPYCQIGSTGVVIAARDLVFRLSDVQPFPEGIEPEAFDLEPDWKGVYLDRVQVFNLNTLVDWLPAVLDLEKWFIGRGGVSGKATAILDLAPDMSAQDFAVRAFRLAFRQNALIEGLVQLAVKLPYFDDKVVYLDLQITNEPELDFPASVGFMGAVAGVQPPGDDEPPRQDELIALPGDPFLRVGVTKLGVRAAPDPGRAGSDHPPDTRFWDLLIDGRVEIGSSSTVAAAAFGGEFKALGLQVAPGFDFILPSGLWLGLSDAARTKLAAFPVSISRIGFGREGAEKWVGLDAAIDFGKGIGPAASVKGLRVFYGGPPGIHLAFDGIELKLVRPGFSFQGFVSMTTGADAQGIADPSDRTFRGDVLLAIASGVGVELEGSVLFGTKAGTRFGYVALDATFGSGIPISPSVSWFGAALLAGVNVGPDRTLAGNQGDNFNWYQHWYAPAPAPFSVLSARKWTPVEDGWAGGAGVTIGSTDGKAWSLRALLAVVAPGPVVIIEGRLRILKTREPHKGPPRSTTIRGLAVLDFEQGDFLLALEVDYKLPESGLLADVHAAGEVFAGHRPGDWHLAIGWPEPISRRVRARALRLLDWDFYLVISGKDLELAERTFPGTALAIGYRTGIDKRGKWGPVRGVLAVWIAGDVALSFKPFYILAQVSLHGEASVKIFGIGFELMLDALLALEAPVGDDDLFFGGKVRIKVGLPWPLPDIKKDIPFEWGDASALPPPVTPLVDGATVSPGYTVVGARFYERETGAVDAVLLPLDGRVTVSFQRPLRSEWAGAPTPVDLALPDRVGDVYYRYTLTAVRVRVTPAAGSPHDATEDLFGQWTLGHGDAAGPQAQSLVLWGLTPFPAAGNLAWPGRTERRSWADLLFETYTRWPCGTLPQPERCVDFDLVPAGTYAPKLAYRPDPAYGAVVFSAWPDQARKDDIGGEFGEPVQLPLAIVDTTLDKPGGHCLRLARTTFLGGADGQKLESGPVGDGVTMWGVSIDLPPSQHARGRVEHNHDLTFMFVLAFMDDEPVAAIAVAGPDFEIAADPKPAFNRVVVRLQPRGGRHPAAGLHHFLCRFCYTTLGALANEEEARAQRLRWLHLLGPLTIEEPETNDDRFGAHLVHEPHATYHIELDVRTESAEALDGTWTDHGVATEHLTVATGGPPADLAPYVHALVPGDGARPFYADYDLRITYNQPYVEAMYQKAGGLLFAELYTSGGRPVEPEVVRSRTVTPAITSETAVLLDRLQATDCVVVDVDVIAGYDETTYRTRLATSTAYEARIRGGGLPDPVYRWSFVTSRYRTFAAHLADLRALPWHERLPAAVDWAAIATRLGPAADPAAEDEAWRAIWQGDFGFPIRTLPERPEGTLYWTEPAGFEARAIGLASPEPLFASERTVLALKRKRIFFVFTPAGRRPVISWVDVPHRVVRSLDGTRALVVPVDAAAQPVRLPPGGYRVDLTFRLSGVPNLPDLSRQGDATDESGSWSFAVPATPDPIVDPEA